MPSNQTFDDVQQPHRLALFAGVFIAGLIGGAVFTSTMAHSQQRAIAQVGAVAPAQITTSAGDPSLPDAAAALAHRRHDRPEAVAPTF